MDITKMELWELYKLAYEQKDLQLQSQVTFQQAQSNLAAIHAEIKKRETKEE